MKKIFLFLMVCFSQVVFAAESTLKCAVDKTTSGGKKVSVPLTVVKGAEIKKPIEVQFEGKGFSAIWQRGDKYESQAYLAMRFGKLESIVYDFREKPPGGPINVISEGDVRFQCWAE